MKFYTTALIACVAMPALALDESSVGSAESERQRLGDERIRLEADRRAREEQQRLEAEEQARLQAQEQALAEKEAVAPNPQSKPSEARVDSDISQMLEQLRALGELKDDGYITEDEFRKIKQRILDNQT